MGNKFGLLFQSTLGQVLTNSDEARVVFDELHNHLDEDWLKGKDVGNQLVSSIDKVGIVFCHLDQDGKNLALHCKELVQDQVTPLDDSWVVLHKSNNHVDQVSL